MSRKRYSVEQWCAWFEEHSASGLTVEQFCRSKGTTANTFYKWRRRLAQEPSEVELSGARGAGSAKKEPPAAAFVSVVTSTAPVHVEIQLPAGASVTVPNDAETLRPILQVLVEIGASS